MVEDEAAFESAGQTVMEIPTELVPKVRQLIATAQTSTGPAPVVMIMNHGGASPIAQEPASTGHTSTKKRGPTTREGGMLAEVAGNRPGVATERLSRLGRA